MFDFHDPLVVFGLFLLLMFTKDRFEFRVPLAIVVSVGDTNIKERVLPWSPESTCSDVQTSVIVCVSRFLVWEFVDNFL